ncbi:GNAT family N-acetyltransferase [Actinacidiphila acididurans]|uniref:GNAT family N-acetyltransferase n=1 Tax=Actinacidiphila acididurans TaxID=2784346 RepID=A0ABS2U1M5_9ACTN|nr:GNAT family N-acetyltransferase [Actinacidiphila acididurans]MBM9508415.1 GNAT family N-acetyltransferase [Actinacidiphila acididurans]
MGYVIRPVAPAEWREIREVRLTALQDPVSAVAFARSYAEESALPDEVWQQRSSGNGAQQFAVIREPDPDATPKGTQPSADWVGMAVVIAERPDRHSVNAVYLRPEVRGSGLAAELFSTLIAWSWERTDRLYLWVHEKNPRAEALYRRIGFERTGRTMAYPKDPAQTEYEMALHRD